METLNRLLCIGITLFLAIGAYYALAQSPCTWVETKGEVVVENMTPEEARQLALRQARAAAIEQISGIEPHAQTLVRDLTLAGEFIRTLTQGYIVDETGLRWEQDLLQEAPEKPPLTVYRVHLKCCVASQGEQRDPYFTLSVRLNKNIFAAGEEAELKIKSSRKCYVSVLNLSADEHFKVLLPNAHQPVLCLSRGAEFVFPPEGLALVMEPLPGHRRDTEAFLVVATKRPFDFRTVTGKSRDITIS